MKVTVFIDRLSKALSLVSRIVSSKGQLPILNNVLLETEEGKLRLTTTNLDIAITTNINAVIEKEGKTTVPVKQLQEIVSLLKDEKIKLIVENNSLILEGEKTKNDLNIIKADDFPPVVKKETKPKIIIKEKDFRKTVEQVTIASSQDESRPILGGVKVGKKDNQLEFATTDGYRLSVKGVAADVLEIDKNYIFPAKSLIEVLRIVSEQKLKEVKIGIIEEKNEAIFFLEETEVITRLIEGEFPNYQKIIPPGFILKVIVDRDELESAVRLSSVFARESANIIKMKVVDTVLTVSANAPQVGKNTVTLKIEKEGENLELAFNYRFLLDFLNVVSGERLVFETNGALNPGVFKEEKETSFLHVIMPVRVQT